MRRLISFGSEFEAQGGYSRAVVDGEWVFVAGTTGFDYAAMTIAEDPVETDPADLPQYRARPRRGRRRSRRYRQVRYYVPNRDDWPRIMPVLAEIFGAIRPAATAVICGLVDERMKIEIEVTARRKANE